MHGLMALQDAFKRHLLHGDGAIGGLIAGTADLGAQQRLAIYAGAYRARLAEALASDYPVLHALLGPEHFAAVCDGYIDAHPSTHYSLRWLGRYLPAHLAHTRPGQPYLAQAADLEWALAAAFDAADAPLAGVEQAAAIAAEQWPALTLRLHPSVHRLALSWNILELWGSVKQGADMPAPQPLAEPVSCLIWREDLVTRFRCLDPEEHAALAAAASGASFAGICEQITKSGVSERALALHAAGYLKSWLSAGLISELMT